MPEVLSRDFAACVFGSGCVEAPHLTQGKTSGTQGSKCLDFNEKLIMAVARARLMVMAVAKVTALMMLMVLFMVKVATMVMVIMVLMVMTLMIVMKMMTIVTSR